MTPQRVKVEEKPEVRKAGGVYYTPKYIVDYIVNNTVGKIIEGKTPRQIEKIKILDPACGSGSFLLGAYQYLIDYHLKWYRDHPKDAQTLQFDFYARINPEDFALPLREKAKILRNNIFGVDIDPQAVEITMMSLYLKALEGERGLLPKKQQLLPLLSNNIKCGNSLIGYDIFDTPSPNLSRQGRGKDTVTLPNEGRRKENTTSSMNGVRIQHNTPLPLEGGGQGWGWDDETKSRINPFDWNSKSAGFGEIMEKGGFDVVIGNPPYVRIQTTGSQEIAYYSLHYEAAVGNYDIYCLFVEKGEKLLKSSGKLGYILPHRFFKTDYGEGLRTFISNNKELEQIIDFDGNMIFDNASINTCILILGKHTHKDFIYGQVQLLKDLSKEMILLLSHISGNQLDDKIAIGAIPLATLTPTPWIFLWEQDKTIWKKLQAVKLTLADVTTHIFQGLKTSADSIYIGDMIKDGGSTITMSFNPDDKECEIESMIMKPLIKGGQMRRYSIGESSKFISTF